jgi:hypothetical protein
VLTRTDAVAMQREDLTLSPSEVRVRYEMRNDTGKPVTLRVAFPLPDMPVAGPGGKTVFGPSGEPVARNIDMPNAWGPNFLSFRLWVDGQPRQVETEIRADLPDGRDIVEALYRIGGWRLVLQPSWYILDPSAGAASADDIGPAVAQQLRDLGAVKGDASSGIPVWTTRITLHWPQTFRPGVTIIEHSYRPILGAQLVDVVAGDPGNAGLRRARDIEHGRWEGSGDGPGLSRAFCIAGDADRAMRSAYPASGQGLGYVLGYILRTARNWHGPIGTFHLEVRGGPFAVSYEGHHTVTAMSLCSDLPLRETAPLRLEATARDYVPTQDLRVLYLAR